MSRTATPPSRLLLLVIGFIVWSAAFIALYGVNAIGCAFAWSAGLQRSVLVALFLAHVAFLVWFARRVLSRFRAARTPPDRMLSYAGLGLTVAALASTVFAFAPSLFASLCI